VAGAGTRGGRSGCSSKRRSSRGRSRRSRRRGLHAPTSLWPSFAVKPLRLFQGARV
jgi:hypothetical protein